MNPRDLFDLMDLIQDVTGDAARVTRALLKPGPIDHIVRRDYAHLRPQDQHDVTLLLEVATSRDVWHAQEAMIDIHAWNREHPNPERRAWYALPERRATEPTDAWDRPTDPSAEVLA